MATKERLIIESLFMIADKEGNDVPFILNESQRAIDTRITGRDIIPKARQKGVSSLYLARNLAKCLSQRNTRAVVISHDRESTERMLGKVHYMLKHMRGPKAITKNESKNELTFPKTDSMFYIGTAGAKKFGRGDTITDLHCSEVAMWEDPKELLAGLFQAVPLSGEISIESTGKGVGNWYHRAVLQAADDTPLPGQRNAFRLHFLDWISDPEYEYRLSPAETEAVLGSLNEDWEEETLVHERGLTAGQIAFRRDKLSEMDWDLGMFKQEYPMTLDECFQSSNTSIFRRINYVPTPKWTRVEPGFWKHEGHPVVGYTYTIGADIGSGIGGSSSEENSKRAGEGDRSVAQVVCLDTREQVAEYSTNSIDPDLFGVKLAQLGRAYNGAFLTPEANNHGIVTIKQLLEDYPSYLIYRTKRKSETGDDSDRLVSYGMKTSVRTRPLMVGKLRTMLATQSTEEALTVHSPLLVSELHTFIENASGKLEAEQGCFDDRVIALACGVYGMERAALYASPRTEPMKRIEDPFSMEAILKELRSGAGGLPIGDYLDFNV